MIGAMKLVLAAVVALLTTQTYPPPFPREGVTKVLENARVVAWRVDWTRGRPTAMHEHKLDLVGVVLESGQTKITVPNGTVTTGPQTVRGAATFQARGVTHIEEALIDKARNLTVELKDEPIAARAHNASAPEGFPREGARLVFENARVAVWDYTYVPGRVVPLHIHNRDAVVVPVDPGEVRVQFRNGETRITRLVPGEALFFSGADAHSEEATVGSPRVIAIELK
jgi:quercetin dioxygenase-like cupin family protein